MRIFTVLLLALSLPLAASHAFAQARQVFSGSATPIGTCGGEVIFTGRQPPQVYSGLYRTQGSSFALVRDYFDSGGGIGSVWGVSRQVPSLNSPIPVRFSEDTSQGEIDLATTCGSVRSTKSHLSKEDPLFGFNYTRETLNKVDIL